MLLKLRHSFMGPTVLYLSIITCVITITSETLDQLEPFGHLIDIDNILTEFDNQEALIFHTKITANLNNITLKEAIFLFHYSYMSKLFDFSKFFRSCVFTLLGETDFGFERHLRVGNIL